MLRLTTHQITKNYLEFSAGHFTIFSATHREKIHGHNYTLQAEITTEVDENGISFDYAIYNEKLYQLCRSLNGYFLLPNNSPYLKISEEGDDYVATYNNEKIRLPKNDVIILPIRNTTIEELSQWFLTQLITETAAITQYHIHSITVKVFSAPGQGASAKWEQQKH